MTTWEDAVLAVELGPVRHYDEALGALNCVACRLTRWPEFDDWTVIGEGVVRGQCFARDVFRYALARDLRYVDVTTEFLLAPDRGHVAALRELVRS